MSVSVVSPVLIGRREEMASLAALLGQAQAREPIFALIGGEAGVGKTRLVREFSARAAEEGFLVLTGQCVELGAEGLPLAPLVDALRSLARGLPPETLAGVLGSARAGLARLLPELAPVAGAAGPAGYEAGGVGGLAGADMRKAQLLEMVLGVLHRLSATRPVLLGIEDLHWADQSTLDLTAFLVRSLRGARVLMLATYRSDELDRRHPLRPLLTSWGRMRSVNHIELRRFDRDEVAAQLAAILGAVPAPDVAQAIFERSDGNAFLVEELAGALRGGGDLAGLSPSLKDVLLSRVDGLSPNAQRLLRTASVCCGPAVPDRLLAEVAGVGDSEFLVGLREVVENHLLLVGPEGQSYAFRHGLTRDAVYKDMLPGERTRLHAAYGAALARDPALAGEVAKAAALVPLALAHHWYAALDLPRALPAVIVAASHAMASYAPAEALRQLERAQQIWPRVTDALERTGLDEAEVSRLAAEAAYQSGAVDRSRSLLAEALSGLPADFDPVRRALLLERYAVMQRDSGSAAEAAATLREALSLLPAGPVGRAHAVVLATLASALVRSSHLEEGAQLAQRAVAIAAEAGVADVEADATITLGVAVSYLGPGEAGLGPLRAGVALALKLGIPATAVRGYINLSDVLELLGRHEEAVRTAGEGLELATQAGLSRMLGLYLIGNQAEPLLRMGEWAEADEMTARALRAAPEGVFAATLRQLRAELCALRGRYDDALSELRDARRALGVTSEIQYIQPMHYVDALIALGRGDPAAARQAVTAGLTGEPRSWEARYAWPLLWIGLRAGADEATRFRDRRDPVPAELSGWCAGLAAAAEQLETPAVPWLGFRALVAAESARVAGSAGPLPWLASVAAWQQTDEPHLLAYALLRLAEEHTQAGDLEDAARSVQRAYAIADRLGAAPIAQEAVALARRARLDLEPGTAASARTASAAEPSAPDELARFGLTEREREVLGLLASGRSNPEIGRILFISTKTASVHVSNILAKLGVGGRVEAASVAHRLGLYGPAAR
jgi:DNA-binding CsgD family transcriptional regulator/tetratricopeptide (TPR) repeat protein